MKKLYKVEYYGKDRQEWLKHRGFGGSSVSAIFGKNPYMNKLDIYCSSVNKSEEKKEKHTASTQYGVEAEELVAKFFAIHLKKYEVSYPQEITMYRRVDKPFMTYTADGILKEVETGRKGILEIKTHLVQSKADADEWRAGNIPLNYTLQVLQGLAVINDAKFVEVCVELVFINYDTGEWQSSEIRHVKLERTKCRKQIKDVENEETKFYENHIKNMIPPNLEIKVEIGE